jgi:hypothetical protein
MSKLCIRFCLIYFFNKSANHLIGENIPCPNLVGNLFEIVE